MSARSLEGIAAEIVVCRACPRLVEWRDRVAREKTARFADQTYWGRPVRLPPCAAGASPTMRMRAAGSPNPGTGRPQ